MSVTVYLLTVNGELWKTSETRRFSNDGESPGKSATIESARWVG